MNKVLVVYAVAAPFITLAIGSLTEIGGCVLNENTQECTAVKQRTQTATLGVAAVSVGVLLWASAASKAATAAPNRAKLAR